MKMVSKLFENSFNIIEFLYLLFILSLLGYLYFVFLHRFLPEEKQIEYSSLARGHEFVMDKYDWTETFRRHRVFLLTITVLTLLVLGFAHIFGIEVAYAGIWVIVIVGLLLMKWVGPVKNPIKCE
jgi:Na+/H+ antiporter NhaD/arsenite permease-like protein